MSELAFVIFVHNHFGAARIRLSTTIFRERSYATDVGYLRALFRDVFSVAIRAQFVVRVHFPVASSIARTPGPPVSVIRVRLVCPRIRVSTYPRHLLAIVPLWLYRRYNGRCSSSSLTSVFVFSNNLTAKRPRYANRARRKSTRWRRSRSKAGRSIEHASGAASANAFWGGYYYYCDRIHHSREPNGAWYARIVFIYGNVMIIKRRTDAR